MPKGSKGNIAAQTRRRYERFLQKIAKLKEAPCMDCGGTFHHAAMDFDHRPDEEKTYKISQMMGMAKAKLEAEIAKCDLVCANCHRVRTFNRGRGVVEVSC